MYPLVRNLSDPPVLPSSFYNRSLGSNTRTATTYSYSIIHKLAVSEIKHKVAAVAELWGKSQEPLMRGSDAEGGNRTRMSVKLTAP